MVNSVQAERDGDGSDPAGVDRLSGASFLPWCRACCAGSPPAQADCRRTGIIVTDSSVTTDSEEQIFVPGAEILGLLSLTKVFRCVLVRESFADACRVCNFCDEAASMGISQEDEFCCVL